jgi:hypothetical protein
VIGFFVLDAVLLGRTSPITSSDWGYLFALFAALYVIRAVSVLLSWVSS